MLTCFLHGLGSSLCASPVPLLPPRCLIRCCPRRVLADPVQRSPTVNNIMALHASTLTILKKALLDLDGHWLSYVQVGLPSKVDEILAEMDVLLGYPYG